MAKTHQLKMSGETPIDLILTAGITAGLGRFRVSPDSNLPASSIRIPESYTLRIMGTSQDNAATQLQALIAMVRKAKQKHITNWQNEPVYLQSQAKTETNTRYALVYGCPELDVPDLLIKPFDDHYVIAQMGFTIIRGVWQSAVPGTLPSALTLTATDGPASPTMVHVSNFRDDTALTHLYNYDHSVTTFSANQYDQTGITLWSVSASTPAADDIVYVGSTTAAWRHFVTNIATAGAFTANVKAEYWDGDSWEELTRGTEFTLYPTGNEDEIFKSTGDWVLNVAPPDNWAANEINSVTAHWIRLYLTTVTDWTTTPVSHGTHAPYFQKNPFVEFASTILKGDIPPIVQVRLFSPYGASTSPCLGACSRIIIGSKSRNLTKFDAYINLGNVDNDGDWATSYSADTSSVADPVAPGGKHAACDFSNSSLMVSRVILTGTNLLDDYVGQYRIFVRVQQVGGSDGDLKIKLRTSVGSVADEFPKIDLPQEGIALKTQDAGWELIDLGVLQIPFGELTAADTSTTNLILEIMAERLTGSSTIEFADIIPMPIDEWSIVLQDPISSPTLGSSALRGDTVLDLDAGVLMDRTIKYYRSGATLYAAENWYRSGEPPKLEPGRQTRLYFLLMHYPVDWGTGPFLAPLGMHLAIEMRAQMIYLALRGSD